MEERFMTQHPDPEKSGVNIEREKYETIKDAILSVIRANEGITFQRLTEEVAERLQGRFDGSISWYVTTVKLDLEARKEIERVPKSSPQQLRFVMKE
jgi:hypothetical protein